ncbi:hypothetical protein HB364_04265 [Pseudoflavitalea sp. X16]|uniref:lamin tail domain-containing protein n=1 Tax=Paraflavitalea devenefica TaxID=2716334 RepID=UPI00141E8CB3|nr:lamin tail domain-containing protein [Paraflavitalea devenefica]NII24278.1 hypothetical protein [Paraflavitalea devenefica]
MTVRLLALLLLPQLALQAQTAQRFDIIITELLPDPAPPVSLPNHEFVELKNNSARVINLRGWKLSDGTSTATINTDIEIQPDSFVIICPNAAVSSYAEFGRTIGVSNFPSLNNEADLITLYAPEGNSIHAVAYSGQWYSNPVKATGGWALEIIDPRNPCTGAGNWTAAIHHSGGTPGRQNSVNANNSDQLPPALLRTWTIDSVTIVVVFDESLDSTMAATPGHYHLDHAVGAPVAAEPVSPLFNEVMLKLASPIRTDQVYQLTVRNVMDCSGNAIGMLNKAKAGLPAPPVARTVIINELLFNPPSGGYDYIELYNRSGSIVDLKQLYVAGRSGNGALSGIQQLSTISRLLFPGQYLVLTENAAWLRQRFSIREPADIIELASLPTLPDDQGILAITSQQGEIIDELHYHRDWHFALLSEQDGVALERIDYGQSTQDSHNWMSAAATTGFGTPGFQNSQFRADLQSQGTVSITPSLFSPDNDGFDDLANIRYQMTEPGYVASITIFDAAGMPVRHLARSATLGMQGIFRWDGLDNNRRRLPVGVYVILTEIFNLQGKTKKIKNTVTLVRRL